MKKIFLAGFLILLGVLLIPNPALAGRCAESTPIVQPCTGTGEVCTFTDFIALFKRIIDFLIFCFTPPLVILFLTIGGIVILVSGGNPELKNLGKKILLATIIGMALVYGAWVIINFILIALGAKGLSG